MKLNEKILIALAVLIAVLKFFFIPGSGVFMVLVFCLLSSLYFYFGFALFNNIRLRLIFKKDSYKGISSMRIVGAVLMGISMSMLIIGLLWKAQHWLGNGILILGIITGVVIFVVSVFKLIKTKVLFYKNVVIRMGILITLSTLILVIPNLTLVKIKYRNHPKYIEVYERYEKDQSNIDLSNELWLEYKRATLSEEEFKHFLEFEYEKLKQPN